MKKANNTDKLSALSKAIGYTFKEIHLLASAVTHRSSGVLNYERLEFLGDSLLNFTIASEIYLRFPKASEGELTRMRALLVREQTLAEIAKELKLGNFLSLGAGELKTGGHQRESILADALEAIIGAIYIDTEYKTEIPRERILSWYVERLNALVPGTIVPKDAKTRLQEYCQAHHEPLPVYQVVEILGDPHNPIFRVECKVGALSKATLGEDSSRRKAEQKAADLALKGLLNAKK